MTIQRIGSTEGLKDVFGVKIVPVISLAVVYNGIVSTCGVTAEPTGDVKIQTAKVLASIDGILEKADKEQDEETHAAFEGLTLHHLRHTFGSWKIAQGEDVVYVSKQMGHSKPSVTYNVYAHLIEKRRPAAAALTDEKLFGKPMTTRAQ